MPKFHPTPVISDCWSSIGDITFYHRNGQCYWKRKARTPFVGSPAQLDQAQVHHRAILAWQRQPHSIQLQWNECARTAPSHRPPYNEPHHISGFNLFVSAYHGFAQLGCEHIPVPQPYPEFPISSLQLLSTTCSNGVATIRCRLTLTTTDNPERWHISARIQLTAPGVGCDPSKMRTYMGIRCSDNEIVFNVSNPNIEDYQIHLRYRVIDSVTGYRNNWQKINELFYNDFSSITNIDS